MKAVADWIIGAIVSVGILIAWPFIRDRHDDEEDGGHD